MERVAPVLGLVGSAYEPPRVARRSGPITSEYEERKAQGERLLPLIRDLLPQSVELNVEVDLVGQTVQLRHDISVLLAISFECLDWAQVDEMGMPRIAKQLREELGLKQELEGRWGWLLEREGKKRRLVPIDYS